MRIGAFSKYNQVSKDTIRHYMDLGLITPEKIGGQYMFDKRCQEAIDNVRVLKNMGFSLSEIKTIFLFKLLGNMTLYQQNEYYKYLYESKYKQIESQIEMLNHMKEKLESQLTYLENNQVHERRITGIELGALALLDCPNCGSKLKLENGQISQNQVIEGVLNCSCGTNYAIQEGILIEASSVRKSSGNFDYHYIADYIKVTDPHYLDNVYKGVQWHHKRFEMIDAQGKVLLDLGSGVGFGLRSIYEKLPENCIYFAVDHDIERHRFLKKIIEQSESKKKVIFMCCDFKKMPIQKESVDILLDFSGSSNYAFDNNTFLLEDISALIKQDASLLGSYIFFKNHKANSIIAPAFRPNFNQAHVETCIANLGFKSFETFELEPMSAGGKYEDYFVEGEEVYNYVYYGKRQK